MPNFTLPAVEDNTEGWGPHSSIPSQFANVPFMPFKKDEKLGRIADFTQAPGRINQYERRFREPDPSAAVFTFKKADEDESFELVDNKPVKKPAGQQQRRPQQQYQQQRWGQQQGNRPQQQQHQQQYQQQRGPQQFQQRGPGGPRQPWHNQQRATYSPSIEIRPDWIVLGDQIALPALQKLSSNPGDAEDLATLGSLPPYDRAADRVTPKMPAKLRKPTVPRHRQVPTIEDPVMQRLASEDAGDVFMTDELLTVLMTAPRTVYPWDLQIVKRGEQLFFDLRPGSSLELLNNGETAPDSIPEERDNINGVQQLAVEATEINQAFREQVLNGAGAAHELGEPTTGALANTGPPPLAYRYKRWNLGGTRLVVRCGIDGYVKAGDAVQNVAVRALNEFDPKWSGVDWRQKLENQRGAVLATELKNNAPKMARWTAAALIGGIDVIKLGYVSRAMFKNPRAHVLLGTQSVKPRDFALQMNLNMDNAWGIVRALVDLCLDKMEEEGSYLLVRDANKPQMRLYAVPQGAILESEEGENGEDDDVVDLDE